MTSVVNNICCEQHLLSAVVAALAAVVAVVVVVVAAVVIVVVAAAVVVVVAAAVVAVLAAVVAVLAAVVVAVVVEVVVVSGVENVNKNLIHELCIMLPFYMTFICSKRVKKAFRTLRIPDNSIH